MESLAKTRIRRWNLVNITFCKNKEKILEMSEDR
jgi:hypothetical protein